MASDLQAAAAPLTAPAPLTDTPAASAAGERTTWLRRTWTALSAPAAGRRITAAIALVAAAVGLLACLYTTGQGSNLDYSDAQSHLTIARRVFDSKAPGSNSSGPCGCPCRTCS